jgi:hypothetical protein
MPVWRPRTRRQVGTHLSRGSSQTFIRSLIAGSRCPSVGPLEDSLSSFQLGLDRQTGRLHPELHPDLEPRLRPRSSPGRNGSTRDGRTTTEVAPVPRQGALYRYLSPVYHHSVQCDFTRRRSDNIDVQRRDQRVFLIENQDVGRSDTLWRGRLDPFAAPFGYDRYLRIPAESRSRS